MKTLLSLFAAFVLFTSAAFAQSAEFREASGDWEIFSDAPSSAGLCYIGTTPTKDEGNYTRRGDMFVLVTHHARQQSFNEIGIQMGYRLQENSEVEVMIGSNRFVLFTNGEMAWNYDDDAAGLVSAMKAGANMVVKGVSWRGTATTDTYSLSGFTKAHNSINQLCNAS